MNNCNCLFRFMFQSLLLSECKNTLFLRENIKKTRFLSFFFEASLVLWKTFRIFDVQK